MKIFNALAAFVVTAGVSTIMGSGSALAGTCNILNFTTSTACADSLSGGGGGGGNVTEGVMNDKANGGRIPFSASRAGVNSRN